jgi:hypothetical protein
MTASWKLAVSSVLIGLALEGLAAAQELDTSGLPAETLGQSTPIFALRGEGSHPTLIFVRSGTATEHDPRVFATARDGWRLVQMPDGFHNLQWAYAGRNVRTNDVWGAAQAKGEAGPGLNLLFASSSVDGRSWRYHGALQKVSRFAVIDMVGMNPGGKGTVILRLDDDPTPDAPRLGFYIYMTKDGGRNWAAPLYSSSRPSPPSDMLAPADKTFDLQQPPEVAAWRQILTSLQPTQ